MQSMLPRTGVVWPRGLCLRGRTDQDIVDLMALFNGDDFQRNGSIQEPFASFDDAADFFHAMPRHMFEVVARIDGTLVGYGSVYPSSGRQCHTGTLTICVDPAYQRQGIGSVLIASLISTAWTMMELSRLQLTVFVDNARAMALYTRFGFTSEGRIARFAKRPDGFVDANLMALLKP